MKTIDFIDSNVYPKKLSDMIPCYFNENLILSGIFAISRVSHCKVWQMPKYEVKNRIIY